MSNTTWKPPGTGLTVAVTINPDFSMTKAIVFDLDGTLLDSLDDLADTANFTLDRYGFPRRTRSQIRQMIGNGVPILLQRAFPDTPEARAVMPEAIAIFKERYATCWHSKTKPYPGINELLQQLKAQDYQLGVLSNKLHEFTTEMIAWFFPGVFPLVWGQKQGYPPKPAPDSLLALMKEAGVTPRQTIFVGDSGVDIQTARAAGCEPWGVTWGFRDRAELEAEGARHLVDHPSEIAEKL
jgi:phosphoglycolate phosphatase